MMKAAVVPELGGKLEIGELPCRSRVPARC